MKSMFTLLLVLMMPAMVLAQHGPPPQEVHTAVLKMDEVVPRVEFVGTVFYKEISNVAAEISGKVIAVNYEEGKQVKAGDILLRLDDELLLNDLSLAEVNFRQAGVDLEKFKKTYERHKSLADTNATSEQSLDDAYFAFKSQQARVESLKLTVDRIKIHLSHKTIKAPFAGVIIERKVELGQWVSEGATIAVLANEDEMDVIVNVPGEGLGSLHAGDAIDVEVNGVMSQGSIVTVIPRGDSLSRTFPVKIRMQNSDRTLMEGMSAIVGIAYGKKKQAYCVTRNAITFLEGDPVVYWVMGDMVLPMLITVVGYADADHLVVGIKGLGKQLRPGLEVVIKGNERMWPSMKVIVVNKKKTEQGGEKKTEHGGEKKH